MDRKVVFILSVLVLLSSSLYLQLVRIRVKASNGYPVHNLNTGLNYTTIQEAIDAPETLDGHQILVESGMYGNITIDKSLTIIGSDLETTTINGTGTLDNSVIAVLADDVNITGFTIQNGYYGVSVDRKNNISIIRNKIQFNEFGLYYPFYEFGYGVFDGSICDNTIIRNENIGVYLAQANDFLVQNNNISFNGRGFLLIGNSYNNAILNNTIHGNGAWHFQWAGLHVTGAGSEEQRPHNTIISGNTIYDNNIGFWMEQCVNTTMRGNRIDSSHNYSFGVMGKFTDDFYHDIGTSNTIDGKPIYYIVNQNGVEISGLGGVGFLGIVNCTGVMVHSIDLTGNSYTAMQVALVHNSTIANITIKNSFYSIHVDFSSGNLFTNINVSNNFRGISISNSNSNSFINNAITNNEELAFSFYESSNNIFLRNNIKNNHYALTFYKSTCNEIYENNIIGHQFGDSYLVSFCEGSGNNLFYHNNFIDNANQVINYITLSNFWDNGLEGNYWDHYEGADLNLDGISDTEYTIDTNNIDNFALMGRFSSFNTSLGYNINIISNSTIEDFQYSESNRTIKMFVSNTTPSQTYGFCRICIPRALMTEPYYVTIDGVEPYFSNYTLYNNGTHAWIYFSYQHSVHEIIIVEEFSSKQFLPVFMVALILVVIKIKAKFFRDNEVE